ncbi:MAG TPA: phosphoribosyltransferase family protein [Ferruginibacter sp.]|jgi:ComF family protein|nr:phosphoribosyltransferase family protein [Ferruginibacter sp.]
MIAQLKNIVQSTLHLFYPHNCTGCGSDLLPPGNQLCLTCIHQLPHTHFAGIPNNPVEKYFWGRIPLVAAYSQFYFSKEFLIQRLIHELKYRDNTDIGFYLGEMMGTTLLKCDRFKDLDALVPLPLYPDKEHKRGYNQATVICNGVAAVMNIPVLNGAVIRKLATETQTRKHRTERWENVRSSFKVERENELSGKHVLLVDDVVTTGATLEACGSAMLQATNCRLSIATLAYAPK